MFKDKNTIIGFSLIGLLLFGMMYFNSQSQKAHQEEQKRIADSIAKTKPKVDPAIAKLDSLKTDTLKRLNTQQQSTFQQSNTVEELTVVENNVIKITFSNKGAQPKLVELKKFKTYNGQPVLLQNGSFNKISYEAIGGNNVVLKIADTYFPAAVKKQNADKSQTITYTLKDSTGKEITHQYTIKEDDYMVDFAIVTNGASQLFTNNTINLTWQSEATLAEKDKQYESQQLHFDYNENGKTDFEYIRGDDDKNFEKGVNWVSLKQQFFISAIVSKDKFANANAKWKLSSDSTTTLAHTTFTGKLAVPNANAATVPLQLYYGPSDYNILKKYDNKMDNIVPYGNGPFAFVKYINRHMLLPVWDFIKGFFTNYGLVILMLTLFIRLITSPILYKSYLSGAKMKALKPEVDALRAKFTNPKTKDFDQQGFGMEQMKLWKSAGVSPLGGCLPALLQIPIFTSLFFFFQANIDLRGQDFLWAKDLASYDTIVNLPFRIPGLGNHISLFNITATLTSFFISLQGMSNMQDNNNPMLKYMPYIFPIIMFFFFNSMPAALTWYYTISNTITLILQFVIQKWIIDPDKIRLQIADNMKKPVKQSKLAERLAAMQEAQKKMQDLKNKGK
ncbi:MAG: membrane protein insertase YidC [Ferruginibacter sp.]|nr:membrane protein insertase YidC [Ferruginibacter sp.]